MSIKARKVLVILAIISSTIPVFFFLDFKAVETRNDLLGLLGRLCGLLGVLIIFWQYFLGFRGLVGKFVVDLIWINKVHKVLGKYGFLIICMHPIFLTLYYAKFNINLLTPAFESDFDKYKSLGTVAISIMGAIWITSALIRNRLSFRLWKRIHLVNYILLPITLFHSLNLGSTLISTKLDVYWLMLTALYIALAIYRILYSYGFLLKPYRVSKVEKVLEDTVTIWLTPRTGDQLVTPLPGQFIYFQKESLEEIHPFTVSHYDETTNSIAITPKSSGKFSHDIQDLAVDKNVFVDGPYGVFTRELYENNETPVVLVIGGIGITPFLRYFPQINVQENSTKVIMFYGNKTENEIAFRDKLNELAARNENFKLINVLSKQESYQGEKGHITADLMQKYLDADLNKYNFFVCGPPAMISSVTDQLVSKGVQPERIHSERFSL